MKKYALLLLSLVLISLNYHTAHAYTESFTVSAGNKQTFSYYLGSGDRIKFWISVNGGANDDIILKITDPDSRNLSNGRIYSSFNDEIWSDTSGNYRFTFDNTISVLSSKQVSFSYEIIKKPSSQGTYGESMVINIIAIVALIGLAIGIAIWVSLFIKTRNRKKQTENLEPNSNKVDYGADSKKSVENKQNENALNILKGRLAKGEITKEEYDKLKKEFT